MNRGLICVIISLILANMVVSLRPCAKGQTTNCDRNRIKNCNTIKGGYRKFSGSTDCGINGYIDPYVNERVIVQFTGSDGCKEILMYPGECWGNQFRTGSNYDCQGRCGASCGGNVCSNWGADCLRHDVCSYYYGASGGPFDSNCGDEYGAAIDDTTNVCWWPKRDRCELSRKDRADSTYQAICSIRSSLVDSEGLDEGPTTSNPDETAIIGGVVGGLGLLGLASALVVIKRRRQSTEKPASSSEMGVTALSSTQTANPMFQKI